MPTTLRKAFDTDAALTILEDVQNQRARYYYFLGGVARWDLDDTAPEEALAETEEANRLIRQEIAYVKRIVPGDVSMVIPAHRWQVDDVFDEWDHTQNMTAKRFYVMTEDFRVYKCIDNNYNAPSKFKPDGETLYPITYPDGYIWKYLYTIPPVKRQKFISGSHIPVQRALSNSFYNNGAIDSAVVTDQGSGYADVQRTSIQVVGVTAGMNAAIAVTSIDTSGSIRAVSITNTGVEYTKGAKIHVTGSGSGAAMYPVFGRIELLEVTDAGAGCPDDAQIIISAPDDPRGTQATAQLIVAGGQLLDVMLTNSGAGYHKQPEIQIIGAGSGASVSAAMLIGVLAKVDIESGGYGYTPGDTTAAVTVGGAVMHPVVSRNSGSIVDVKVIDSGAGYVTAPQLIVSCSTGEGNGIYGNEEAQLSAVLYDGEVKSVVILDPGVGYSTDTSTTISVQGTGEGAAFTPVVIDGRVVDVITENPGEGYSEVYLTVHSATGSGAKVRAYIGQSDLASEQSIVEQTAIAGAIYNIKVSEPGEGYQPSTTTVTVTGNGTGCVAEAVLDAGRVKRIKIVNPGSGYTYANVTIADRRRVNPNDDLIDASAYAIMPPARGHGNDAVRELYADTIQLTTALLNGELGGNVTQDFRTYGVLKDPQNLYTDSFYAASSELIAFTCKLNYVEGLTDDEVLVMDSDGGVVNRFRVMSVSGNTAALAALDKDALAPLGVLYAESQPSRSYASESVIGSVPVLDKYSGDMIFVTTDDPFTITPEQNIVARTFIKM